METQFGIGTKVKHIPSGDICTITKVNSKTFNVTVSDAFGPIQNIRIDKKDCVLYVEPKKEKTFYEIYRERTIEMAQKLPPLPKETSQAILWLKSAIIEKVENIDKVTDPSIYTFRKNEDNPETKKFGFSEQYVNLLMEMAYNEGRRRATEEVTESNRRSITKMKAALDKIKDALDEADWIDYPNSY
jgi:hypothetical protein